MDGNFHFMVKYGISWQKTATERNPGQVGKDVPNSKEAW